MKNHLHFVNIKLSDDPSLINKDPESEGWIFKIEISNKSQFDELMNESQYNGLLKND